VTLEEWARSKEETNTETEETYQLMADELIAKSRAQPMSAYDVAISLQFMGLPNEALTALRNSPSRPGVPWLELDLLLETERFVEVLEKAEKLERKYSSNPEASFSAVYAKAIALNRLGQKHEALMLLEGIVKVRPGYRSAHSLLLKWKADEK
jgi:predicted Zn-dependent protease